MKIPAHTCIKWPAAVILLLGLVERGEVKIAYASGSVSELPEAQQQNQGCQTNTVFERVNQLIGNRQYDQAAVELDGFRTCAAHSPLETFEMGWLYGRARRFGDALKVFESVPTDVPDKVTHNYAIALSRFELGQYQQVIDTLGPEETAGKADEKAVNLLAVSYSKLGQYRDAYDLLSREMQRDPSDLTTRLNLVTVCAEAGNFAKAAEIATHAKQQFPNSADVFIVLGAAETMLGRLDQAFEDFSTGARLAPSRADARFFLALVDYKQGKFSDAVTILQTAVKDGIRDSDLHYLMAECLLKTGSENSAQALQELDRAIDLNANSVSARTLRGKLLLEAGHPKEALPDLELARQRQPDSRAAAYNLARAYQAVGRDSEAEVLFKEFRAQAASPLNEFSETRLNQTLTGKAELQP